MFSSLPKEAVLPSETRTSRFVLTPREQRSEVVEAYIASQKSEGWTCLPTRYDDGG